MQAPSRRILALVAVIGAVGVSKISDAAMLSPGKRIAAASRDFPIGSNGASLVVEIEKGKPNHVLVAHVVASCRRDTGGTGNSNLEFSAPTANAEEMEPNVSGVSQLMVCPNPQYVGTTFCSFGGTYWLDLDAAERAIREGFYAGTSRSFSPSGVPRMAVRAISRAGIWGSRSN
jgi:hypothetical protein